MECYKDTMEASLKDFRFLGEPFQEPSVSHDLTRKARLTSNNREHVFDLLTRVIIWRLGKDNAFIFFHKAYAVGTW